MNAHHPLPRSPSEYTETDHFEDALNGDMRYLTREMVADTIKNGADFWDEGGAGNLRRRKEFDGVNAVLVIDIQDTALVTGWTEIHNITRALNSDTWTHDQLKTIQAFERCLHKRPKDTW